MTNNNARNDTKTKILLSSQCGSVAETVAYDFLLEVAMKIQNFQQRNLLLHGHWKWLVNEFASYYGVSDAYTKLRYEACTRMVVHVITGSFKLLYFLWFSFCLQIPFLCHGCCYSNWRLPYIDTWFTISCEGQQQAQIKSPRGMCAIWAKLFSNLSAFFFFTMPCMSGILKNDWLLFS